MAAISFRKYYGWWDKREQTMRATQSAEAQDVQDLKAGRKARKRNRAELFESQLSDWA